MKLAPVKGFRKREIARGAKHWLNGRPGLLRLAKGSHRAIRTGSGPDGSWVNTKHQERGYRKLGPDHGAISFAQPALSTRPAFRP